MLASFSAAPLLSVSVLAWFSGNPFNGTIFFVFAAFMAFFALKADTKPVSADKGWTFIPGILLLIFGLVYPHFLETNSFVRYLYAAPTGVIPCPTLSAVIGLALIFDRYGSNKWSLSLAVIGLFYGVFGVFRLGVTMDVLLLAGALALLFRTFQKRTQTA